MAKLMDASPVIASASTQEELDLAKDFGADVVINYTQGGIVLNPQKKRGGVRVASPLPKPTS
jgi:NADPH:quinone reductase-like Zn-dependent oxidoreductase